MTLSTYLHKSIKFPNLARANIALLGFTFIFHYLSVLDGYFFGHRTLTFLGFKSDPLFGFGLVGILVFVLFLAIIPLSIIDYICSKISAPSFERFTVTINDMKLQKDGVGDNIIRILTYTLVCFTSSIFIVTIMDGRIVIPFTFIHMLAMAFTTLTHGMQLLAMYRIFKEWVIRKLFGQLVLPFS